MKILGAAIGNCVHVAGVFRFLSLAKANGYETIFLGPAVSIDQLMEDIKKFNPDIVGVSYRLTSESAEPIFQELKQKVMENGLSGKRWILGCTAPIEPFAQQLGLFEHIFTGFSTDVDSLAYLRGYSSRKSEEKHPQDLVARIILKSPMPMIRHHFGLPSLEETIEGVKTIAEASVLDVISIGPDQDAQQSFFRPNEMRSVTTGDGGVPLRTSTDLKLIFGASRTGNLPLLRCYSGTRDLIKWSKMLKDTINTAWCATPLVWYSELDGRSRRTLENAFRENQENHRWHAEQRIPVEVNEAHQWSLRCAHDTIAVAMAYLAAYNAKSVGVHTYVSQYMLNTPLGTSPKMDLAKMLAKIELIESLHDHKFTSIRQVRPGLFSYPPDMSQGKGQLSASIYTGMLLNPQIVHVVGFCEADHATTAKEVIESCKIAQRVIHNCMLGSINPLEDSDVRKRKEELVREATLLINAITNLGDAESLDPLTRPETYARAIRYGVLDAPHLRNNSIALGELQTRIISGACYAISSDTHEPLSEEMRLAELEPVLVP